MGVQVTCEGEHAKWRHATITFNVRNFSEDSRDNSHCPVCELSRNLRSELFVTKDAHHLRMNELTERIMKLEKMLEWWEKTEAVNAALGDGE